VPLAILRWFHSGAVLKAQAVCYTWLTRCPVVVVVCLCTIYQPLPLVVRVLISQSNPNRLCLEVSGSQLSLEVVLYLAVGYFDHAAGLGLTLDFGLVKLHTFVHDELVAVVAVNL